MAAPLIDPSLLHELRLSLERVQQALDALPEYPERRSELLATLDLELRGLRGAFEIVEAGAAEQIAREMRTVLALPTLPDAACAALNDAALLLDSSLDREPEDRQLLPVLNALRAARGEAAISAAERFAARALAEQWPQQIARSAPPADSEPASAVARRELAGFQTAFLAWFRNPAADEALARLAAIAGEIAARVDDDRLRALWLGHAALADSLIGRRIDALDTRRLLGRAGSQLKMLADQGEAAAVIQAGDTLWLLVHALQSADREPARALIAALRPESSPAATRAAITPDRGTRAAVLAALQVEFAAVKDAIDLRLRGSAGALAGSAARLGRVATVIDLLGHPAAAARLREPVAALDDAQAGTDLAHWLPIAERLLRVESGLEAALLRQQPGDDDTSPHPQERREAGAALLRELLIDVARLKSALERGLRDRDAEARAALAPLLHGLSGGLQLLADDADAAAVAVATAALEQHAAALAAEPPPAFAAAIVGLEAWLEARRDGSPRAPALAASLQASVAALALATADGSAATISATVSESASTDADSAELRALFLDEAAEVLAGLDALRPAFQRDPTRSDTLAAIRRAFHTLKGSGRTVGADTLGEVGAAIETLLNRCLDGALGASRALVTVVDDAMQALPALIADWRDGQHAADAISRELIERAERVVAGPPSSEPDVRGVFCSDSRSRLAAIRDWLASRDRSAPAFAIDDSLSRSFHTLKGAAAIVNAVAMSRLAGLLETALDPQQHGRHELPVSALPLLDELVQTLAWWVEAVADEEPVSEEAADRFAARIAALHEPPQPEPEPQPEPVAEVQPEPAPIDTFAEAIIDAPAPMPMPEPARVPAPEPDAEADSDVDPELQDIFFGEAQELLEAMAVSSSLWAGAADDARSLGSLRRGLHTLKGSARMAAASAIGAVAHRLETMLERPADHAPATLLGAFDAGLDGLQRQLDALKAGSRLPAASMLAAIDAALGIAPAAKADVVVPVAAPAVAAVAAVLPPEPDHRAEPEPEPEPDIAFDADPVDVPETAAEMPAQDAPPGIGGWLPELFWTPDDTTDAVPASRRETARVPVERLDAMLSQAGEIAIARARLDEHHAALKTQLAETTQTIARIREQLRQMDIETDAQIRARSSNRAAVSQEPEDRYAAEFDALEMDRYSRMQELSRALAESVGDLGSLHGTMEEALGSAETLLVQQGRQTTELQQGLMGTLMVPFSRQEQRLTRVVRQTAHENGRDAEPVYIGTEAELDRNVLERMTAPLEHLLRNAVVHGIEPPEQRLTAGKPARGSIEIKLARDGAQLVIEVGDDGRGLDYAAIRDKAIERGLMSGRVELAREALARFIFEPGFSTASRLTQDAGRGIGMDVVANQVRQLGGTLELRSEPGQGARFVVRLPLALAVAQALLVGVGNDTFAIPLTRIEGVGRLPREQADALLASPGTPFRFADTDWQLGHLADYLDLPRSAAGDSRHVNAVLVRLPGGSGERQLALVVDRVLGNREIVSKGAGPQLGSVAGIGGATILADGRVAMILDLPGLIADHRRRALLDGRDSRSEARIGDTRTTVLVVDDSITVRRVAERLLLRHGYRVLTARDGVDAMALLHGETPDAVLLDIEMPRADGFEVAAFIRKHARLSQLPIVMVTSRSGEKHRARARQLGVDGYLTKPWQDDQLLATLRTLPGIRQ